MCPRSGPLLFGKQIGVRSMTTGDELVNGLAAEPRSSRWPGLTIEKTTMSTMNSKPQRTDSPRSARGGLVDSSEDYVGSSLHPSTAGRKRADAADSSLSSVVGRVFTYLRKQPEGMDHRSQTESGEMCAAYELLTLRPPVIRHKRQLAGNPNRERRDCDADDLQYPDDRVRPRRVG
jgi:hypothetical protein